MSRAPFGGCSTSSVFARRAPLDLALNIAVREIANQLFPCGFDVDHDEANIPDSLTSLDTMMATGRLTVWGGASEHTIYEDAETNYHGRAWHDWCHWKGRHEFTPFGEFMVVRMQQQHLRKLYPMHPRLAVWCDLIAIDTLGVITTKLTTGEYPVDQRAFAESILAQA